MLTFSKPARLPRGALVLSASQLESWLRCKRLWWFQKVHKLPDPKPRGYFTFGTVLHAVIERWLQADSAGRVNGVEVDLYPPGWESDGEGGTISPEDAMLVKAMIGQGINDGVLQRRPGRLIEPEFWVALDDETFVMGYIDVLLPDEVQDHKSTKDFKYAKTEEELKVNTQLLIYAKVALERARQEARQPLPEYITLRHNVFAKQKDSKGSPRIRVTSVAVTVKEIEDHWAFVKQQAKEISTLKHTNMPSSSWPAVPGAPDPNDACNAYGGCPYLPICYGGVDPEDFRNGVRERPPTAPKDPFEAGLMALAAAQSQHEKKEEGSNRMSAANNLMALLMKNKANNAAAMAAAGLALPETTATPTAPAAPTAPTVAPPSAPGAPLPMPTLASLSPAPTPTPAPAPVAATPPQTAPLPIPSSAPPAPPQTAPPAVPFTQALPINPPAPPQPVVANDPVTGDVPPWADAGCMACGGTGFGKSGAPCKICDGTASTLGAQTSEKYQVDLITTPEGQIVRWSPREGTTGPSGSMTMQKIAASAVGEAPKKRGRPKTKVDPAASAPVAVPTAQVAQAPTAPTAQAASPATPAPVASPAAPAMVWARAELLHSPTPADHTVVVVSAEPSPLTPAVSPSRRVPLLVIGATVRKASKSIVPIESLYDQAAGPFLDRIPPGDVIIVAEKSDDMTRALLPYVDVVVA